MRGIYGVWGEKLEEIGINGDWTFLFQGKEYVDFEGYDVYDFHSRSYDPWTGRFNQVDGANQFASGYTGMANNPVSFIDPDGQFAFVPLLLAVGKAIAVGAAIGGVSYTASVGFSKGGFNNWSWGQFGKSVGLGAASGAVSFGIGSAAGAIGGVGGFAVQTAGHATWGGINSMWNGGDFWSGALSGGVGNIVGGLTDGLNPGLRIGSSALMGGISSELAGGDFWRGFATGATVAGANHLMHPPEYEYKGKRYKSKKDLYLDILGDQAIEHYGIEDIYAALAALMGDNTIATRGKFSGATQGTSVLSEFLRKEYPQTFNKITKGAIKKLPTLTLGGIKGVTTIGAFAGRTIPLIGWGMLIYDGGSILYNTQKIYNRVTANPR